MTVCFTKFSCGRRASITKLRLSATSENHSEHNGGRRFSRQAWTTAAIVVACFVAAPASAQPADRSTRPSPAQSDSSAGRAHAVLTRQVRNAGMPPVGRLAGGQVLDLDIVLPLRNQAALDAFLAQVADPRSPSYRHFLTVAEFTSRFGPTQQDYGAVIRFAKANGFAVIGGTRDGMDVQIKAPVSTVEAAFNVTMRTYRHPTENRMYYAPDREPTTDLQFPLLHISGLDNYSIPHPALAKRSDYPPSRNRLPGRPEPQGITGSGPSDSFLGSDMRAAYFGVGEDGRGQNLALVEFTGAAQPTPGNPDNLADVATYFKTVGQVNHVPITLVSTDGSPTACVAPCDDTEPTIDITQAVSMAPGLSSLVLYIGSSMGTSDTQVFAAITSAKPLPGTISSSWTLGPGNEGTDEYYFKRMAAQGQTFFQASGDGGPWSSTNNDYPADSAYVVSVGGTDLTTTGPGGVWQSEIAWHHSGGGISPNNIPIPSWQQLPAATINTSNGGSTVLRNGPDVSANANFSFYTCSMQTTCMANVYGGTSFAAPMWAALMALVNEEAAVNKDPPVGFINPNIYRENVTSRYQTDFNDITVGNNALNPPPPPSPVPNNESAVPNYDLVTGWGTPRVSLITALAPPVLSLQCRPGFYKKGTQCDPICPSTCKYGCVVISIPGAPNKFQCKLPDGRGN
jgi:subtilase family serine protease